MIDFNGWCADTRFLYIPKTKEKFNNIQEVSNKYGHSETKNMWINRELWIVNCCGHRKKDLEQQTKENEPNEKPSVVKVNTDDYGKSYRE